MGTTLFTFEPGTADERRMRKTDDHDAESADSTTTAGQVLATLFFLGAASGALTLILPHPSQADDTALWSNVAAAFVAAFAIGAFAKRLRPWMVQLVLVLGTLTITRAVYFATTPVASTASGTSGRGCTRSSSSAADGG
jgi:hypothetical protein